jgi:glycosyltransferase involved in cell wall biosynthesis
MPTYGRPEYVGESVAMFLAQDYPAKELIVLNDCVGQTFHCDLPGVRVINASDRYPSLGEKRNAAIEMAAGDILAVWDDDDVHLPWRLSLSLSEMQGFNTEFYRPAEFWAYWSENELHDNQAVPHWISHGLVLFTRNLWKRVGSYPPQGIGEDAVFFDRIHRELGQDFIKYPISRDDRFYILRGTSLYHHMSISGGSQPLDTSPVDLEIIPKSIQDPLLREASNRLIERHQSSKSRTRDIGFQS